MADSDSENFSVAVPDTDARCELALDAILDELARAIRIYPNWPLDPVHATAIVAEEAGQALRAALDFSYERTPDLDALRVELRQTAAMAIRALYNIGYAEVSHPAQKKD